jgi:hypothetical protein
MSDRVRSGGIFAGCATLAVGILVLFGPPKDTADASEVQKAEGQNTAQKGETAGEKFKNVQVLKDIPADQLVPSMLVPSVGCRPVNPCHSHKKRSRQPTHFTIISVDGSERAGGRQPVR